MEFLDDYDLPQVPSAVALMAARLGPATLKNWCSRNPPAVHIGAEEKVSAGERMEYNFCLRRVLQLAITVDLVGLRIPPREAALHAFAFTDIEQNGHFGFRERGRLFTKHYTLMLIYPSGHDIVNAKADENWRSVLTKSPRRPVPVSVAAIVNLNEVDRRVRHSLGLSLIAREGVI